jgi:predicted nucleic acid-binding protein
MQVVIDSSVLVGLLVPNDLWHQQSVALWKEIKRATNGALNFNDALIALACREREIPTIASFDADFDQITWLRLAHPEDLTPD